MKKTLFSTTSLVAAGMLSLGAGNAFAQAAAPATPEPLKIAVGGFMTQMVGYARQSDSFTKSAALNFQDSFDTKSDTEIYFKGSVKLDNGYTVGVVVELEADGNNGAGTAGEANLKSIDNSYMTISGDIGVISIGSHTAAATILGVQAPQTGILNPYNGDMGNWSEGIATMAVGSTTYSGADQTNRIRYVSPSFGGLRIGGSFSPSNTSGSNLQAMPLSTSTQVYDVAVQYAGTMGDVGIKASVEYWKVNAASTTSTENYQGGLQLSMADFTVGGGYQKGSSADVLSTSDPATKNYNVGVQYSPGGYGLSLAYQKGFNEDTVAITADNTHSRVNLGATYDLGPGVMAGANLWRMKAKGEGGLATENNTSTALVGGIKVSF